MALASTRDFFSGFVGGGGFEVAVAMLQGATTAFSWSLGFSPTTQLRVSDIVPARQKIPPQAAVKRSGCRRPDGISPRGALNWTFIELIIE